MKSQPQNPEFRFNPENFHPCIFKLKFHEFVNNLGGLAKHLRDNCIQNIHFDRYTSQNEIFNMVIPIQVH